MHIFLKLFSKYIYMMLIHKSHVFEMWIETKFEVCEPCSFFDTTYVVYYDFSGIPHYYMSGTKKL